MAECIECSAALLDGAKYCSECGAPAPAVDETECRACGSPLRDGAKFCVECGTSIAVPTAPSLAAQATGGKCPECGDKVPMFAEICPDCGTFLSWTGPGVKVINATCSNCGRNTASTSRTCMHCGTPIDWAATYEKQRIAKGERMVATGTALQHLGCAGMIFIFVFIPLFVFLIVLATSR